MRITLITLFTFSVFLVSAQPTDLSGTWLGTSTFLKDHFQLKYELDQTDEIITGFATTFNPSNGDSIKVRLEGIVKKSKVMLSGVEIIYQSGLACMADNELTLSINNGQTMLTGRWKGSMDLNTCPPLTSGTVSLMKQEVRVANNVDEATSSNVQVSADDQLGNALVNELNKRNYYALIIGVNEYNDDDILDLDNPVNDASRLAEVLMEYYTFEPSNVNVLKNPTRGEIIMALDLLAGKVTEKDNLLIFYAGHGIWNSQLNQGYWLPRDASMNSKSYWLSNSTLRDYVGGISSKHTLLISDACFSGGILKERAVFENSRAMLELYKLPSRKAMTSGTLKTVPDESVFMHYLIKNLINNPTPLLSADQLFRSFKTAVINNSPNGQVPQYGPIAQTGDEGGDFIFLRRPR